jgi:hypothetical protein
LRSGGRSNQNDVIENLIENDKDAIVLGEVLLAILQEIKDMKEAIADDEQFYNSTFARV